MKDVLDCRLIVEHLQTKNNWCRLLLQKWNILKEIHYVLKIPYDATIALQKKTLTLSDAYEIWLKMTLHLKALVSRRSFTTDFPKRLLVALQSREDAIFNNPLMTCALFLDPRFNSQIVKDSVKVDQATRDLVKIWHRINSNSTESQNIGDTTVNTDSSFEFDSNRAMEEFLTNNQNLAMQQNACDIQHLLEAFNPEYLPPQTSVLKYWELLKEQQIELYKIAMVVYSVPPTEVQIERDFSRLNFVFGDLRCNLTEERLEDIMFIHLNDEVFYKVKDQELKEAQQKITKCKTLHLLVIICCTPCNSLNNI